ncbi:uncharacterized protein LOC122818676 isoform X1 [Drosophila biarmipes]|uniref:uncharacterized protein LOC122818676 isoform X1 n=1 Tax=Drosophila biarmipes TaxID=125945 RepID=UPI0007E5E456|nr:uncharacterized protein LOC122818676 isoform X1 [Drosophila biarmipes]
MPRYPNSMKMGWSYCGEEGLILGTQVEGEAVDVPSLRSLEALDRGSAAPQRASRSQRQSQSEKEKSSVKRPSFKKAKKGKVIRSNIIKALQTENLGDIVSVRAPGPYKFAILRGMTSLGRRLFGFINWWGPKAKPRGTMQTDLAAEGGESGSVGQMEAVGMGPLEENPSDSMSQLEVDQEEAAKDTAHIVLEQVDPTADTKTEEDSAAT